MSKKKAGKLHKKKPVQKGTLSASNVTIKPPSQQADEVIVESSSQANFDVKGKEIHSRRRAPLMPEGVEVPDPDPSPPIVPDDKTKPASKKTSSEEKAGTANNK